MQIYKGTDTTKANIQIQTSVAGLAVRFDAAAASSNATDEESGVSGIIEELKSIKFTAKLISKVLGTETIMTEVPLLLLLEQSSAAEGSCVILDDFAMGFVELGIGGALKLDNESYIQFEFDGNDGAGTLTIELMDSPVNATGINVVHQISLDNNEIGKEISLKNVVDIAIPQVSMSRNYSENIVKEVSINYGGKTMDFSEQCLKVLASKVNDFAAVGYHAAYGYGEHVILNTESARSVKVDTGASADGNFIYLMKNKEIYQEV